ncbi:hypothetical protein D9756_009929 [Leucocoprinus leucothites]|uniref:Uncharacterized protein n=1 Tax=Leucocoprinus leucothites TaxID=201217 RepID=A0A8H5FSM6_9AGAR|nr:hypothetical protein D9756_009929 [Leucoagaricus leucothites]
MVDRIPASYRPDEPPFMILGERTWLQGAFLAAAAYGIEFILFVMTFYFLLKRPLAREQQRQNRVFIAYISIVFILSTLYIAALLRFTQLAFIDGRNIPYGPFVFENTMFTLPSAQLMSFAVVIKSWVCDVVNLWRSFVIYKGCRAPSWLVNLVPMILYLGSVVVGILYLYHFATGILPGNENDDIDLTLPYFSVSLGLNILVTLLLVFRLLLYRRRVIRVMGQEHGSQYASLAAVIVESAAIHSSVALLLISTSVSRNAWLITPIFVQLLSPMQGISTFLIFFRVAKGKGWTSDTHKSTSQVLSTLKYEGPESRSMDERAMKSVISQRGPVFVLDISPENSHDIGGTRGDMFGVDSTSSSLTGSRVYTCASEGVGMLERKLEV